MHKTKKKVHYSETLSNIMFQERTGYEVGTAYDLPRVRETIKIGSKSFPFYVRDSKEAGDRFGATQCERIPTMLYVRRDFRRYATVSLPKPDAAIVRHLVRIFARKMKLTRRGKSSLVVLADYFHKKVFEKKWKRNEDLLGSHFTCRRAVNKKFWELMQDLPYKAKYKNFALGMVRYAVGVRCNDFDGD